MSDAQDMSDILDAEPQEEVTPLNLASMDLPDLELDATPKSGSGEALDTSHE
jgi:hypothetical protein